MTLRRLSFALALLSSLPAQAATVTVSIDAAANRHAINPQIYGVAFGNPATLSALNAPLNRQGGNPYSTYNWRQNVENRAEDYYFESIPQANSTAGAEADAFVKASQTAGARALLTVPLIGWIAKVGPGRSILASFSVAKYGAQCSTDPFDHDAGDGLKPDCSTPIKGNDKTDAYVQDSLANEKGWVSHLIAKWGLAAAGGVPFYLMDNEATIWHGAHRDVHPVGAHATEFNNKVIAMAKAIKTLDPGAKIVAPEEWGWDGYFYSGYDQQYAASHGYTSFPDHDTVQGGLDYIPWLLTKWKAAGHPVDVLSVHIYPQGGEFGNNVSTAMQLKRNRSTRELWDPTYKSQSWIADKVYIIPRLKQWVSTYYYAGTPVALTEYNWGAENHINGATAQADILGIFGREGLDLATRWTTPGAATPTFKAMQMYRNYDGAKSTFGDVSVKAAVPNPDNVSAFAAERTSDNVLTVMVINKQIGTAQAVKLALANFTAAGTAKVYRLTSSNVIQHLPDKPWTGGALADTEPAQSITLYVLPK